MIISLGINIYQGVSLHQQEQSRQELFDALFFQVAYKGAHAIYLMDCAIENNDRNSIYTVSSVLRSANDAIRSEGVDQRILENVSFSTAASLLCHECPDQDHTPIGRPDDNTPLTEEEIQLIKELSKVLEKFVRVFWADPDYSFADFNTLSFRKSYVSRDLDTFNRALQEFYTGTDAIWDKLHNLNTPW